MRGCTHSRRQAGNTIAYVLPITHTPPLNEEDGIEIPAGTKQRLRLDAQRSWIITTELDQFIWPGPTTCLPRTKSAATPEDQGLEDRLPVKLTLA